MTAVIEYIQDLEARKEEANSMGNQQIDVLLADAEELYSQGFAVMNLMSANSMVLSRYLKPITPDKCVAYCSFSFLCKGFKQKGFVQSDLQRIFHEK